MASRSRGRPVHGRVGRASVPWLPAPAGVPLRAWRIRRAAMGSRSRGRPVHGRVGRASVPWLPAPAGVPLGAWRIRRAAMGSRSRGRPVHGRVGRASVPWLPAPAGVPLRAWRRPPCGYALPRVRPPAASPVRPCAGAVLRPPHFHHSIWKANDKPAPPNVMISLRFPAAGAERGAPGAACSTAFACADAVFAVLNHPPDSLVCFAPRGRGFRAVPPNAFAQRPLPRKRPAAAGPPPAPPSLPGPRHAPFWGCGRPRRAGVRARFVSTLCW